jgi:hypothetical protein
MKEIVRKLTSRKFLMSVICVVIGVAMAFGIEGSEIVEIVGTMGGVLTALGGAVTYIRSEAMVDAASLTAQSFMTEVDENENTGSENQRIGFTDC